MRKVIFMLAAVGIVSGFQYLGSEAADTPPFSVSDAPWRTDFSRHTVPLEEIVSGGPPRDGIPPIDDPAFVAASEADGWLGDREPVIAVSHGGAAKAYPLQILIWHEIVNDSLGNEPLAVTFCPLCNSAVAFKRRHGSRVLDFGTTGRLRYSDLVMWDRQTETWWQQLTGEAIIGALAGERLETVPASIVSYKTFKDTHPQGLVLDRPADSFRDYGRNPYTGYDDVDNLPFLYHGDRDPRLPPMERVVAVSLGDVDKAYPYRLLADQRVVDDAVEGQRLVVLYSRGTASALDASRIAEARDAGSTGVFIPDVDGKQLTLSASGDQFTDAETGSTWNVLGKAVDGPLAGAQLEPVVHGDYFAFAWLAFRPDTLIHKP